MAHVERVQDGPVEYYLQDLRPCLSALVPLVAERLSQEMPEPDITTARDLAGDVIRQHGLDASSVSLTKVTFAARQSLQNELQSLGEQ